MSTENRESRVGIPVKLGVAGKVDIVEAVGEEVDLGGVRGVGFPGEFRHRTGLCQEWQESQDVSESE